ncbi:MAG: hypothetical protein KA945_08405 [Zoogloea sp.]|jgi:hypothetical protein|nr:hypothetical protein [Zoogloea sp.]
MSTVNGDDVSQSAATHPANPDSPRLGHESRPLQEEPAGIHASVLTRTQSHRAKKRSRRRALAAWTFLPHRLP